METINGSGLFTSENTSILEGMCNQLMVHQTVNGIIKTIAEEDD